MVKSKLDEHGLLRDAECIEIDTAAIPSRGAVRRGVRARHALGALTPSRSRCTRTTATIFDTGDYKIDHTRRSTARATDLAQARATRRRRRRPHARPTRRTPSGPGITQSEQLVAAALKRIIRDAPGRVIVTSFSSHIHRLQGVIDASEACGRKRRRRRPLDDQEPQHRAQPRATRTCEEGTLIKPHELDELPDDRVTVLCTGSQGEPMSALTRIAYSDHRQVQIQPGRHGDHVGQAGAGQRARRARHDERALPRGARVLHQDNEAGARLGPRLGRGAQDDARARASARVHAGARRAAHAGRARRAWPSPWACRADRIHVCDNGDVLVLERGSVRREGSVEAGVVFVDGLGIGDPKDAVLRDRRQLSADGTLIVVCQLHRGPQRASSPRSSPAASPPRARTRPTSCSTRCAPARARSSTASTPTACASTSCCRATSTTSSPSSSGTARASARSSCPVVVDV